MTSVMLLTGSTAGAEELTVTTMLSPGLRPLVLRRAPSRVKVRTPSCPGGTTGVPEQTSASVPALLQATTFAPAVALNVGEFCPK
jgi:hypothetical protein